MVTVLVVIVVVVVVIVAVVSVVAVDVAVVVVAVVMVITIVRLVVEADWIDVCRLGTRKPINKAAMAAARRIAPTRLNAVRSGEHAQCHSHGHLIK